MNRRTFTVLAVIAVLLAILAIFAQRGSDQVSIAGASAGQLLLPDLAAELEQVDSVGLTGAGRERLVSLEQVDETWTVTELDGYAAETATLNALLIALAEARIVEEKTTNPAFFERLGVEAVAGDTAAGLEVTLRTDSGKEFAVVLGDAYGSGQRYARLADSNQSVLIDRNPEIPRAASDWVRSEIIDIPESRVRRVTITHADGESLVLEKESAEAINFTIADIPAGRELQYASIADATGNVLSGLTLEAVAARSGDNPAPAATVRFQTYDGLLISVEAQAGDDESRWLVFEASVDPEFSAAGAGTDAEAVAAGNDSPDPNAEADAINARLADWRYRIPAYKYDQLTRRMDDLLRELPDTDE